ncbi:saccharopine dehydrogenase [Mobilicoccus pelagius]|uniref:Saccharopine dehydrogenase [NAD(+), L-lysine-forming] n=1 Tax=Mobilicoccus pelagius NBRC 104925 TaxID=1089455 RepID=H5UW32_9MICO|nr:saccharopine dehydrogenase [Mobilicoccus pelagius]GAB49940.1 putative saccharopine dehydrogenase [Mobilicoccus pelagius NBRC 104925]
MTDRPQLWLRHEVRPGEGRAAISPHSARVLREAGFPITVEESDQRSFPLQEYVDAGCETAPTNSWPEAPEDAIVVGLKELPEGDTPLRDHVYFGHAFKHQHGAKQLLERFVAGGGTLLDLEYLVDENGRRVAAFGYWAGYVGAALAVLDHRGRLEPSMARRTKEELDALLREDAEGDEATALVIGALGRSGRGACDALEVAGIATTRWDVEETKNLDKEALIGHDILVNCVMVSTPVPPFVTAEDLDAPGRRLSVISDVTCDVTSDCNVLPIYDDITSWPEPVRVLRPADPENGHPEVRIIAIDNLPSLLPAEAAGTYAEDLLPTLLTLPDGDVWQRARARFEQALADEGLTR